MRCIVFLLLLSSWFIFIPPYAIGQIKPQKVTLISGNVGGAIKGKSGKIYGSNIQFKSAKNGVVKLLIKNYTGRKTTNVHISIQVKGYTISNVKIVNNSVTSETDDTETSFFEVKRDKENNEISLKQPDNTKDNNPISLPSNGELNIEFQIKVQDPPDSGKWVNLPEGSEVTSNVYWTKGRLKDTRRPIYDSIVFEKDDENPLVEGLQDIIIAETFEKFNTNPEKIRVADANHKGTQSLITLPDIVYASIEGSHLNDGELMLINQYELPFDLKGTSIFVMPYLSPHAEIPKGYKIEDTTKRYINLLEGGGVFKDPNIITSKKINKMNELEFTLNAKVKDGVPWEAEFLKPGAFMIRGLRLKIGGGIGNKKEWKVGDKIFIGAKGRMINNKVAEELWHVATIVE